MSDLPAKVPEPVKPAGYFPLVPQRFGGTSRSSSYESRLDFLDVDMVDFFFGYIFFLFICFYPIFFVSYGIAFGVLSPFTTVQVEDCAEFLTPIDNLEGYDCFCDSGGYSSCGQAIDVYYAASEVEEMEASSNDRCGSLASSFLGLASNGTSPCVLDFMAPTGSTQTVVGLIIFLSVGVFLALLPCFGAIYVKILHWLGDRDSRRQQKEAERESPHRPPEFSEYDRAMDKYNMYLRRLESAWSVLRDEHDIRGRSRINLATVPRILWMGGKRFFIFHPSLVAREMKSADLQLALGVRLGQVPYEKHVGPVGPLLDYVPLLPFIVSGKKNLSGVVPPMLFRMETWFHFGLFDRTSTIKPLLPVKILDPLPQLDPGFKLSLSQCCAASAQAIISKAKAVNAREIWVLWSGGIDSTASLLALRSIYESKDKADDLPELVVLWSDGSQEEYQWLWQTWVEKLPVYKAESKPPSRMSRRHIDVGDGAEHISKLLPEMANLGQSGGAVLITGEHGDQIFGSALMKRAFGDPELPGGKKNWLYKSLDQPWESVIPKMMVDQDVCPDEEEWLKWMRPQVAQSPIPIVSVFDYLWWINFSLKWQHVTMRLFQRWPVKLTNVSYNKYQGTRSYAYMNMREHAKADSLSQIPPWMFDRVIHFYRDEHWQQWSYHNHSSKLPDRGSWKSYKEPLKAYIRDKTGDDVYYRDKEKEVSSWHPFAFNMGIAASGHVVRWGQYCTSRDLFRERYGFHGLYSSSLSFPSVDLDEVDGDEYDNNAWWIRHGPRGAVWDELDTGSWDAAAGTGGDMGMDG